MLILNKVDIVVTNTPNTSFVGVRLFVKWDFSSSTLGIKGKGWMWPLSLFSLLRQTEKNCLC